MTTKENLLEICSEVLGCSENDLQLEGNSFVSLGADSLDLVEIITETEEEFDISISQEEVDEITNFSQLLAAIEKKLKKE